MNISYEELVARYGPGQIVTASKALKVASLISVPRASKTASYRPLIASSSGVNKEYEGNVLHFRFILTTSGANDNDQFFVEDEIARPEIFRTPIGEPVNEDHDQSFRAIVGEIYDAEFVSGTYERPAAIVCRGVIFTDIYPHVGRKVRAGAGRWAAVSMEAMPRPLERVGKYLVIHNPKFTGVGIVRMPANPYSKIVEVNGGDPNNPIERYEDSPRQAAMLKAGLDQVLGKSVHYSKYSSRPSR